MMKTGDGPVPIQALATTIDHTTPAPSTTTDHPSTCNRSKPSQSHLLSTHSNPNLASPSVLVSFGEHRLETTTSQLELWVVDDGDCKTTTTAQEEGEVEDGVD